VWCNRFLPLLVAAVLLINFVPAASAESPARSSVPLSENRDVYASCGWTDPLGCLSPIVSGLESAGSTVETAFSTGIDGVGCFLTLGVSCGLDQLIAQDLDTGANATVGWVESFVASYVAGFFVYVFNAIGNAILDVINTVEDWILGGVLDILNAFTQIILSVFDSIVQASQPLGPLAPIGVVLAIGALFLLGFIGIYFIVIFLIAIGKTGFNLL
jgi:hypothetical protein